MKKAFLALVCTLSLLLATSALAADYGKTGGKSKTSSQMSSQADHIVKADDLTGKSLQDKTGADIGNIKSVVIDTSNGAAFAMVSLNDKLHPVPVNAITKSGDTYTVNIEKNRLAQSPSFTEDEMKQQMAGKNFDTQVYRFFGITPPSGSGKGQMKHKKSTHE